jgi:hypothetical protein
MMNSHLMNMEAPIGLVIIAVIFFAVVGIAITAAIVRHLRAGGSLHDFE